MIYTFADCVLDSQLRQLSVAGEIVHLEPQVFDVLQYLVENSDRVVPRDDLVEAVWRGRVVSEATIGARIWAARHAVGDSGDAQQVIQTLPRRGFRLVALVTTGEHNQTVIVAPTQNHRFASGIADNNDPQAAVPVVQVLRQMPLRLLVATIMMLLVGVGAVSWWQLAPDRLVTASVERMAYPLPDKPSIAVLPFTNLSGDAAQDSIGEGLTESLVNALARNPTLFVIAAVSTSRFSGQASYASQAAEELGVRYIVEGSVKRSGDRVRVMTQLVDAISGQLLWSARYERRLGDLLALDEEITARIARSLDIRINHGTERASGGTRSLEAWAAYVEGRKQYEAFTAAGISRAREHFLRALELDPNYAEAKVGLAYTYLLAMAGAPAEDWPSALSRIAELEHQAAAIAPGMPRLLELRSLLALAQGDYDLALRQAEQMAALDPNGAESHFVLGRMYFFSGHYERAIESFDAAARISPYGRASYSSHLAFSHLALGHIDAAIALLEAVTQRSPEYAPAHADLAIAYQLAGRDLEARRQAALLPSVAPDITVPRLDRRFSPMQDRQTAQRILVAARLAGIPDQPALAVSRSPVGQQP